MDQTTMSSRPCRRPANCHRHLGTFVRFHRHSKAIIHEYLRAQAYTFIVYGGRVWLTCVGRRCTDGRNLLGNRLMWSWSVVPFRWSCARGHGCDNKVAQFGVIIWEMRCAGHPILSNGCVFRWLRTRETVAYQTF